MKNIFKKWNVINDDKNFNIQQVISNDNGLTIILSKYKISYKLNFEGYFSYRVSDESILFRIIEDNSESINEGVFYIVENSSYIDFLKEKGAFYDDVEMDHFAIYTENECVDIISDIKPTVIFQNHE